ncbi:EamA family transporter [Thalassolituus sp. LLYu03]|uniref:EamA family transporter n=1 Tax=Thalassolituus sp. LLYu03 TaxID=3421656 RepID=UPI003D287B69
MWIVITLFAAACQSVRTAYQNTLSREAGFLHATMARSLYGLPLVSVYLGLCVWLIGSTSVETPLFWPAVVVCAVSQILATWCMLRVFHSGSFALGTLLAKTEAVLAALIGLPLLHYGLTLLGWLGIVLGVAGALVMSVKWHSLLSAHKDKSLLLGLASGLCFAITSVTASMASHAMSGSLLVNAGVTLWCVLALQSLILCGIQMVQQRDWLAPFRRSLKLSTQVGILSSLGSIGWFTGFALVNPALVKTLGQIEIVGTLYFSRRRFGEAISRQQWWGGAMIVISVLLVTLAGRV